jgi:Zn-dependent protease with chaperone function
MTDKLLKSPSKVQRVVISLILLGIFILWVSSEKFWFAAITFGALFLTLAGFSRNVFLSNISGRFGLLVAKIAYAISRKLIQLIYIVLIVPLNVLIRRRIIKQYNIDKPESEFFNSEAHIDFESYF